MCGSLLSLDMIILHLIPRGRKNRKRKNAFSANDVETKKGSSTDGVDGVKDETITVKSAGKEQNEYHVITKRQTITTHAQLKSRSTLDLNFTGEKFIKLNNEEDKRERLI